MTVLKDGEIRQALVSYLKARSPQPSALIHELRVNRGNAIADLVALYSTPHCFEIKGATDSIRRVLQQAEFYGRAFKKLTLVTTPNHRRWAEQNLPTYWGIMIASNKTDDVRMAHIRPARTHANFEPHVSLAPLWREELSHAIQKIAPGWLRSKHTREEIAEKICRSISNAQVSGLLISALISRQASKPPRNESDMS